MNKYLTPYLDYVLVDDPFVEYGGVDYAGETLDHFLGSIDGYDLSWGDVNCALLESGIKPIKIHLSNDEFNALNKIATATKMDCWFWPKKWGPIDIIWDLENDTKLSLRDGVSQLFSGMVEPAEDPFYCLTDDEIKAVLNMWNEGL